MSCITCYYTRRIYQGSGKMPRIICEARNNEDMSNLNYIQLCERASTCPKYCFYTDTPAEVKEERREMRRAAMLAALKEVEE